MNKKLQELYVKKLKGFKVLDSNNSKFSKPFLIKAPEDYIYANNKVMVLGQETHNWNGSLDDFKVDDIDMLIGKHEQIFFKYVLSEDKSKGKSRFLHRLRKINNSMSKIENTAIVWNNLLKFDYNGKSSKKYSEVVDKSIEILKEEIKILKPDVLLCQTGPQYDFILKKLFPTRSEPLKLIPRRLWKFNAEDLLVYRISHPCARVKGGIKQYYHESIKDIKNTLDSRINDM